MMLEMTLLSSFFLGQLNLSLRFLMLACIWVCLSCLSLRERYFSERWIASLRALVVASLPVLALASIVVSSSGDQGVFSGKDCHGQVLDCIKQGKIFIHKIVLAEGSISLNDEIKLEVNAALRDSSAAHHSATHLMHAALEHVLGNHV